MTESKNPQHTEGGYVVLENVSLSLKLNLFSRVPLPLNPWPVIVPIQVRRPTSPEETGRPMLWP